MNETVVSVHPGIGLKNTKLYIQGSHCIQYDCFHLEGLLHSDTYSLPVQCK